MPISLYIKRLLTALLVVTVGLVSCSKKQSEEPESTQGDTIATPADAGVRPETIKMVVGGILPSGPEKQLPINPATFRGWKTAKVENIKLLCLQDHAHASTLEGMGEAVVRTIKGACQYLGIEAPNNPIVVIYYTGPGQAKEITGMNYPFSSGDTLHHWPPNYLGNPVMKYLIPKWQKTLPRFEFLRQGLITLLDGSRKDYHQWALRAYRNNSFVPLSALAVDGTIRADNGGQREALSASFVDFVVYAYGIDALGKMYISRDSFDETVEYVLGLPTDSLQAQWLNVLGQIEEMRKDSQQ